MGCWGGVLWAALTWEQLAHIRCCQASSCRRWTKSHLLCYQLMCFHRKWKLLSSLTEELICCTNSSYQQCDWGKEPVGTASPGGNKTARHFVSIVPPSEEKAGPGQHADQSHLPSVSLHAPWLSILLPHGDGEPQWWFLVRPHT